MTKQTFKYAGYSAGPNGTIKARFGNDLCSRIKKLKDRSPVFLELPKAMTKAEASQYVLDNAEIPDVQTKDALMKVIYRNANNQVSVQNMNPAEVTSEIVNVS